jgi:hypothetical protein
LVLVLPIRAYTLKRAVVQHGEKDADASDTPTPAEPANAGDVEKAPMGVDAKQDTPAVAATAEKTSGSD